MLQARRHSSLHSQEEKMSVSGKPREEEEALCPACHELRCSSFPRGQNCQVQTRVLCIKSCVEWSWVNKLGFRSFGNGCI